MALQAAMHEPTMLQYFNYVFAHALALRREEDMEEMRMAETLRAQTLKHANQQVQGNVPEHQEKNCMACATLAHQSRLKQFTVLAFSQFLCTVFSIVMALHYWNKVSALVILLPCYMVLSSVMVIHGLYYQNSVPLLMHSSLCCLCVALISLYALPYTHFMSPRDALMVYISLTALVAIGFESFTYSVTFAEKTKQSLVDLNITAKASMIWSQVKQVTELCINELANLCTNTNSVLPSHYQNRELPSYWNFRPQ